MGLDWPFESGDRHALWSYPDKTSELLKELIELNILKDNGYLYQDEDEPDEVYIRNIGNAWLD